MEKVSFKIIVLLVLVGFCLLWLTGCSCKKKPKPETIIITNTVEVDKPVYVCPSEIQNLQRPTRPTLMIELIDSTDNTDPGRVAQYYKITIKQLLNYAQELEAEESLYNHACNISAH